MKKQTHVNCLNSLMSALGVVLPGILILGKLTTRFVMDFLMLTVCEAPP